MHWWILGSVVGWAMLCAVGLNISETNAYTIVVSMSLAGFMHGIVTTFPLLQLLQRPILISQQNDEKL